MYTSFEPKTQESKRRASHEESQSAISYPSRTIVHAKLEMTNPGDQDEQEADAVANEVVNGGKIARKISGGGGSSGIAVSRQMGSRLSQLQGGGQPMPTSLRSKMESGFGQDFAQVRLHTDDAAGVMNKSISARAFTLGNDIYFSWGQFNPYTNDGQRLIAHELAHVIQNTRKICRKENDLGIESQDGLSWDEKINTISEYSTVESHCLLESSQLHPSFLKMLNSQDDDIRQFARDRLRDYKPMVKQFMGFSQKTISRAKKNKEDGKRTVIPVTVVICGSAKADECGAFFYTNRFDGKNAWFIFLQEIESISTATRLLKYINEVIGPIRNLIISGHGEYDSIRLNADHSFKVSSNTPSNGQNDVDDIKETEIFFNQIRSLMPEEEGKNKKIVFDSCLTDSHVSLNSNIKEVAQKTIGWTDKKKIIAGRANLDNNIRFSFNKHNLTVSDQGDGISRLGSDTENYVGKGAIEPVGHIRGIAYKFYKSKSVVDLYNDLAYFSRHVQWKKQASKDDIDEIKGVFSDLNQAINNYLKGFRYDPIMEQPLETTILNSVDYLVSLSWKENVAIISETESDDPILWDDISISMDDIVRMVSSFGRKGIRD